MLRFESAPKNWHSHSVYLKKIKFQQRNMNLRTVQCTQTQHTLFSVGTIGCKIDRAKNFYMHNNLFID